MSELRIVKYRETSVKNREACRMKTIFKYELAISGLISTKISLPSEFEILGIHIQHGCPVVWILVDPTKHTTEIFIKGYMTGARVDINQSRKFYLDTCLFEQGNYVLHYFLEQGGI